MYKFKLVFRLNGESRIVEHTDPFIKKKGLVKDGKSLMKMAMAIWRHERKVKSFAEFKEQTGKSGKEDFNAFYTEIHANGINMLTYGGGFTPFEVYRTLIV